MAKTEAAIDHENAEFAELALKSLKEGVRRALIDHELRGLLVPGLHQDKIEWISPRERLSLYPAPERTRTQIQVAEQGAEKDV